MLKTKQKSLSLPLNVAQTYKKKGIWKTCDIKSCIPTKVTVVLDHKFKIIITRLKHIFINQNRFHYSQNIFPNEKYVYFCSIKVCASGLNEILESIFCLLLVVESFSLQKVVEVLEEVVVGWRVLLLLLLQVCLWEVLWSFFAVQPLSWSLPVV